MRFMQIASFYPAYLNAFYGRDPARPNLPFDAQIAALLADGFGGGHLIAPYMAGVGYETMLVVTNAMPAQTQWALAHGIAAPRTDAELRALIARQIETFAPDVLYVLDPITFDARFIAGLSVRPYVVGWRAANIPAGVSWQGFDLMLSSDEGCRRRALEIGARAVAPFRPGFPVALAKAVADVPKTSDLVFCGQITVEHGHRLAALAPLVEGLEKDRTLSAALHMGLPKDARVSDALKRHDRGSVWGLDMYRAVRGGKIAPNFHIDLATTKNQNMRILETTGVGTFLMTEADPNLAATFAPGREVETYANPGELLEKCRYFLDHATEREAIAKRGQDRCIADHAMERRAETLAAILNEHTKGRAAQRPAAAPPTAPHAPEQDPQLAKAIAHLAGGRVNEAADIVNGMIQREPSNARAIHLLGRVAFLVGETASAAELFQTAGALKLPPEFLWVACGDLAAASYKAGRKDDALTALRQAYALAPQVPEIASRLIMLLEKNGATAEVNLLRARHPDAPANVILESLIDIGHIGGAKPMTAKPAAQESSSDLSRAFPGITFGNDVQCIGTASIRIGAGSVVGDGSWLNVCIRDNAPRMVIGDFVLIGRRAVLSSGTYLEIGSHTIFGPNVYVSSAEHEYIGNHEKPILMCGVRDLGRLVVEENCWLGMNAVVDGNITIGRGSVVGANSVLRRSLPPFCIAVGAPARIVRMLNPVTNQWEPVAGEADVSRIEEARKSKPFPERAAYKATLDKQNAGRPLHPVVAGLGLHLS